MNCPIGMPLLDLNCTECPYDTHHCFSFVIGQYADSMCCPNGMKNCVFLFNLYVFLACPITTPIEHEGRCYPRVAFGGHCEIDAQCDTVRGAVCKNEICACVDKTYKEYGGVCYRREFKWFEPFTITVPASTRQVVTIKSFFNQNRVFLIKFRVCKRHAQKA